MEKHEVFIGVDVSKSKLDVSVVIGNNEKALYHQVYANNKGGIRSMFSDLKKRSGTKNPAWLFCLEHTGVYAMPFLYGLSEKKLDHALVPAIVIQRSMGLKRGKSDKADSLDIARYACLHQLQIEQFHLPDDTLVKLKLLLSHRERLVNARVTFQNASKETGAFLDASVVKELVKESKSVIVLLNKKIKKMDERIEELVRSNDALYEPYKLATSVPGIGPQIAYHLLVHTHCFKDFSNSRKLACYMGIAPFEYTSGSSIRGRTRVSHWANKKLKALMSMGALSAVRFDSELKNYYERKLAEGKHKTLVLNAVKNKLTARVMATVKRGTPYVPIMKYAA